MSILFPKSPRSCGLGVGLDLPWGRDPGMVYDEVRGEIVSDSVVRFLDRHHADFGHLSSLGSRRAADGSTRATISRRTTICSRGSAIGSRFVPCTTPP